MIERQRLGILVGFASVAAILLVAATVRQQRSRPCTGDPVPARLDDLAARFRELPVIARPALKSSEENHGCVSYTTHGTESYELGPFVVRKQWSQAGNDTHANGMAQATVWLRPAGWASGSAWDSPFFDGPDFENVAQNLELRGNADAYLLVGPAFNYPALGPPSAVWGDFIVPLPRANEPDNRAWNAIAFRIVRHAEGHKRPVHPVGGPALVLLLAAAFLLQKAFGMTRRLDWEEGTIVEGGFIEAKDGSERAHVPEARFKPGDTVLFRALPGPLTYRASSAAAATDVWPGSRDALRARLRTLERIAVTCILLAGGFAVWALLAVD